MCRRGRLPVTPALKLGNGTYRWWVQGKNSAGAGPLSAALTFTIINPPTLLSPSGLVGGTGTVKPTYTWNAVPGRRNMTSGWERIPIPSSTGSIESPQPQLAAAADGICSVMPSAPLKNGNYVWYVMARTNGLESGWSAGGSFTVRSSTGKK